jgi:hypothetical protein
MPSLIDLTLAETAPFEATEQQGVLSSFAGAWRGTTKLWLDPSSAPEETTTTLLAEPLLGGRWLRLSVTGTAFGKPHAGEMLLGFHKDAGEYEAAWIDSSHTGSAIMFSKGRASERGIIDVLGSYLGGEERWGWRTVIRSPAAGELLIEAFNVAPNGGEERAMESSLRRMDP